MPTVTAEQVIVTLSADNKRLIRQMNAAEGTVNKATSGMASSIRRIGTALAGIVTGKKLIEMGDAWSSINGRLKLVTNSTRGLVTVQNELFKVSQDSRADLESTVTLYTKLARSTKGLGISQKELLGVTETINKAIVVSGASAVEASAALNQLGQGLASGTLRGEELNSILEQTPRVAEAIANGMGIAVGQLREMGSQGLITSETVINALKSQASVIEEEFSKMPQTVGQAFTKFGNVALKVVGEVDQAFGVTTGLAKAINAVSTYLEENKAGIIRFGAFAGAVIERTKLLFIALGLTIKTGFKAALGSVQIAFSEFQLSTISGIFQMAKAINELRSKLGKKAFDLTGLRKSFQDVAYESDLLRDSITQTGLEAVEAWKAFAGYDIVETARANIQSMTSATTSAKERAMELGQAIKNTNGAIVQSKGFWDHWGVAADAAMKKASDSATQAKAIVSAINSTISSGLTSAFRQSLDGVNNWGDAFKNILKDVLAQIFKVIVAQRIAGMITGGGAGAAGAGAGAGITASAKGNAFSGGHVTAYAKGGVVDKPTFFGMAGGRTGLMGEAGSEAIMPLDRMSDGSLGVKAAPVNVNVINNAGVSVQTEQDGDDFNITLERIDSALADGVRRNTSSLAKAINGRRRT